MRKIIPYILILAVVAGLFSPISAVYAQESNRASADSVFNTCMSTAENQPDAAKVLQAKQNCINDKNLQGNPNVVSAQTNGGNQAFENAVDGACAIINIETCIIRITYWLFYVIPSFLLLAAAKFFNIIIALTLSSKMYAEGTT